MLGGAGTALGSGPKLSTRYISQLPEEAPHIGQLIFNRRNNTTLFFEKTSSLDFPGNCTYCAKLLDNLCSFDAYEVQFYQ